MATAPKQITAMRAGGSSVLLVLVLGRSGNTTSQIKDENEHDRPGQMARPSPAQKVFVNRMSCATFAKS
jgi:hypothetical protein